MSTNQSVDFESDNSDSAEATALVQKVEDKCKRLYQHMTDAVLVYDYEREEILDCNEAAVKLLGYTKEDLLSINRFDLLSNTSQSHPGLDVHEAIRTSHKTAVFLGQSIYAPGEVLTKGKKRLFAKINVVSLGEGAYQAFVIIQDVTNDFKIKKKIEETGRRNSIILENTDEGIMYYCLNRDKPIHCNKKAFQLFGLPSKGIFLNNDLQQYYLTGLTTENSANEFFKRIVAEAKKSPYTYVYQAKNVEGEKRMLKSRAVYDGSESAAPKMIFFISDITDMYEANEELNRLFNQQKQILNAIPAPFLFKDLNNKILLCNKALSTDRGYASPNDLIGKNLSELISEEHLEKGTVVDMELIKSGSEKINTVYPYLQADGTKRWIRNDKTPYRDEFGKVTGILSYLVDITEIMEKNERLKTYIESNKQLNNFASIASHDLQAPLRTIHSFTQLLQRKIKDKIDEEEIEYMQFIMTAANNMRHLIRDLRTYSQVDSGSLNVKSFCMNEMVKEVLSELTTSIDRSKASISIATGLPFIQGDRIKLKQLIQNLLINALKYVADGSRPEIQFLFEDQPQNWYFEIEDNGIGIAPEFQKEIFELFRRLHGNTGKYQGTGIGLSLCKKVVEQHQGHIGVRSEKGVGSTFFFTIAKKIETVQDLIQD